MRTIEHIASQKTNQTFANETNNQEKSKKNRIWELDFIRGLTILGMVVDHGIYDLINLRGFFYNYDMIDLDWVNRMDIALIHWYNNGRQYFHNFAILFFLICGISSTFSKNNWKHALKILLSSLVLMIASYSIYHISFAFDQVGAIDFRLLFGTLYALGMGALFVSLIPQIFIWFGQWKEFIKEKSSLRRGENYTKKKVKEPTWTKWVYLGVGAGLILFWIIYTYTAIYPNSSAGYVRNFSDFWYWWIRKYDSAAYLRYVDLYSPQRASNWFAQIFGLNFNDFLLCAIGLKGVGSDFFSLIPWVGWTLIGAFLGKTIYKKKESLLPKLNGKWNKPFTWVGINSLWVYIFHQPLLIVLISIVFCPMGYRFF